MGRDSPEKSILRTFGTLKQIIKAELKDPWGKVNAYLGVVLLLLLCVAVFNYVAGSIGIQINLPFLKVNVAESGIGDFWMVVLFVAGFLLYWFLCLKVFVQVKLPASSDKDEN